MKKSKVFYLIVTLAILALIFYFSVKPSDAKGEPKNFDKLKHLAIYLLLSLAIYKTTGRKTLSVFLAGIYGYLLEVIQFTIPYRSFSLADVFVNLIGASLILPLRHKKQEKTIKKTKKR